MQFQWRKLGFLLGIVLLFGLPLQAQMISPSIDPPNAPFNYVAYPTGQMGILYNSDGTEITPEGFLYTGFTELMFFTGNPPEPIHQRIRTLYRGYLPIFQYRVARKGVCYKFQTFANSLTQDLTSNLMNFVRVTVVNHAKTPRHDFFSLAMRYTNANNSHRFRRPSKSRYPGAYWHSGVPFNPNWKFTFDGNGLFRNDSLMLVFPRKGKGFTVRTVPTGRHSHLLPTQPAGWVHYDFELQPGDSLVLDFTMPYRPIPKGSASVALVKKLTWGAQFQRTVRFWENLLSKGMQVELPESKVVNTFKTSLIYNLMALNKFQGNYIQTVNLFHYHAFWLRDGSFVVREYDLTGYHDLAKKCLNFFLKWQKPNGNFLSQGGQYDGWGQTLWAFGQHYELTGDKAFVRKVFPAVKKAVAWLHKVRAQDEYHIMPSTRPGDNERIKGHVTGHNFWALLGLRKAIVMARAVGDRQAEQEFQNEYNDYHKALLLRLKKMAAVSGGYIPPGLDKLGGQDWGNLLSVYPTETLDPWDPMVSATQSMARSKFREGLITYGNQRYIHNYLTTNVTETSLVRGEQRDVLRDLYSILLHTTSTNAGFEYSVVPWADRDVRHNLTPHGWFAAKYRGLIRDMLVREEGKNLHLFSVYSPQWLQNGVPIGAKNAPTVFGPVSTQLVPDAHGAAFTLTANFRKKPAEIVVHIPWFVYLTSVEVDGKIFSVAKQGGLDRPGFPKLGTDRVVLSPDTRTVRLNWQRTSRPDEYSYQAFVDNYKREFVRKYRRYLQTNTMVEY